MKRDHLVVRTVRAERFALDVAKVIDAVDTWRELVKRTSVSGRPAVRAVVEQFDALVAEHPGWRETVREMGEDVEEFPLGDG